MILSQIYTTDIFHSDQLLYPCGKSRQPVSARKLVIVCIGQLLLNRSIHHILRTDLWKLRQITVFVVRILPVAKFHRDSTTHCQYCGKDHYR